MALVTRRRSSLNSGPRWLTIACEPAARTESGRGVGPGIRSWTWSGTGRHLERRRSAPVGDGRADHKGTRKRRFDASVPWLRFGAEIHSIRAQLFGRVPTTTVG